MGSLGPQRAQKRPWGALGPQRPHVRCGKAPPVQFTLVTLIPLQTAARLLSFRLSAERTCAFLPTQSRQVMSSHVMSSHVMSSHAKSSQVMSSQVKPSHVKSSQVKSSQKGPLWGAQGPQGGSRAVFGPTMAASKPGRLPASVAGSPPGQTPLPPLGPKRAQKRRKKKTIIQPTNTHTQDCYFGVAEDETLIPVPQVQLQEVVRQVPRIMNQEIVRQVPVPQIQTVEQA